MLVMSYYVLRQIYPPGKSARADQATTLALAMAARINAVQYGPYLEWSDPDAKGGMGKDQWTDDPAKAKRFPDFAAAMECWKAQSTIRPFRTDGRPNRPMTAYSVAPIKVEE
jgi:hypothetical protein